ncbi:hypothetical protein NW768_006732 [Fusarium equiseti]|uniref:non-specific serine/threonine protein kinase n=1 Tax=Fusarium equiseti TaxID=61235 RepID=A0ABQ8R906_FUSEQ|nr:hypothetical protein NW768_006732 [Fusarium equiseti]
MPDPEDDNNYQNLLSHVPELLIPNDPDFKEQLQDWAAGLLLQGIQYQSNGTLRKVWFVDNLALASFYRDTPEIAERLIAAVAPGQSGSLKSDRILDDTVDDDSVNGKVYALKTFNTISSEIFFTAEMRAFTHLEATNHRPAGLIEFYGGISCPPTYSIILEYMDRGDLDQYWKSTSAPFSEKDVYHFWSAFTVLAEALAFLHEIPAKDGERILGWHQDIKPSNILVASGTSGDPYNVHFKLADFGLSHFERKKAGKEEIVDWDSYGNGVYGSPETARWGEVSRDKNLSEPPGITQAADVWSLGCVCSEALLWVVFGYPGIEFFRGARYEERSQATADMPHIPMTSFHDGRKTLDAILTTLMMVEDQVSDYLEASRALITSISGIVRKMLSFEPQHRPKASDIVQMLGSALQHKATVPEQDATGPKQVNTRKILAADFPAKDDLNMAGRGVAEVTTLLAEGREQEATETHKCNPLWVRQLSGRCPEWSLFNEDSTTAKQGRE